MAQLAHLNYGNLVLQRSIEPKGETRYWCTFTRITQAALVALVMVSYMVSHKIGQIEYYSNCPNGAFEADGFNNWLNRGLCQRQIISISIKSSSNFMNAFGAYLHSCGNYVDSRLCLVTQFYANLMLACLSLATSDWFLLDCFLSAGQLKFSHWL